MNCIRRYYYNTLIYSIILLLVNNSVFCKIHSWKRWSDIFFVDIFLRDKGPLCRGSNPIQILILTKVLKKSVHYNKYIYTHLNSFNYHNQMDSRASNHFTQKLSPPQKTMIRAPIALCFINVIIFIYMCCCSVEFYGLRGICTWKKASHPRSTYW